MYVIGYSDGGVEDKADFRRDTRFGRDVDCIGQLPAGVRERSWGDSFGRRPWKGVGGN